MAALQSIPADQRQPARPDWYARPARDVASAFAVEPAAGLTAAKAAALLAANGPNALPEEKPRPMWLRFLHREVHSTIGQLAKTPVSDVPA